jgi:hypothetical protein
MDVAVIAGGGGGVRFVLFQGPTLVVILINIL